MSTLNVADQRSALILAKLIEAYLVGFPERFQETDQRIAILVYCWEDVLPDTYVYRLISLEAKGDRSSFSYEDYFKDWQTLFAQVFRITNRNHWDNYGALKVIKFKVSRPSTAHEIMQAQSVWQQWQDVLGRKG